MFRFFFFYFACPNPQSNVEVIQSQTIDCPSRPRTHHSCTHKPFTHNSYTHEPTPKVHTHKQPTNQRRQGDCISLRVIQQRACFGICMLQDRANARLAGSTFFRCSNPWGEKPIGLYTREACVRYRWHSVIKVRRILFPPRFDTIE